MTPRNIDRCADVARLIMACWPDISCTPEHVWHSNSHGELAQVFELFDWHDRVMSERLTLDEARSAYPLRDPKDPSICWVPGTEKRMHVDKQLLDALSGPEWE